MRRPPFGVMVRSIHGHIGLILISSVPETLLVVPFDVQYMSKFDCPLTGYSIFVDIFVVEPSAQLRTLTFESVHVYHS